MEPEINQEEVTVEKNPLHQVTPMSKYFALALFVILPFLGGYIGYVWAPEKVVEVEIIKEVVVEKESGVEEKRSSVDVSEYSFVIEVEDEDWRESFPIFSTSTVSLKVGSESRELYVATENCVVKDVQPTLLQDTNARSLFMGNYVTSVEQVYSEVQCWVAGGGYEMYLIQNNNQVQVIGFTVSEGNPNLDADRSPFGEPEVLYP